MSIKKPIPIEDLLCWTYRDELPKQAVGGLSGWERLIFLGTNVDESDRGGDSCFPVALGAPHPDALLVDYAVRNLPDRAKVAWPRMRAELLGELSCWVGDNDPLVSRMQAEPIALVMMHARMGTRPRWDIGPTRVTRSMGKNGKPVVHGLTAGRRYADGACCPLELDPTAQEIASARWEYAVWRSALDSLAGESWNLADHVPLPPRAAAAPWRHDDERKPRIHWPVVSSNQRLTTSCEVA